MFDFDLKLRDLGKEAKIALAERFAYYDEISEKNTEKIIDAFREFRVSEACFAPTSGYGYDDRGRDTLDAIFARVFDAEAAFVRFGIANGTCAIATALYGLLRPGDILYSVTSKPYDTLDGVIGCDGVGKDGNLAEFGVKYMQTDFLPDGTVDIETVKKTLSENRGKIKVVFIQRSKGYMNRQTLSSESIGEICRAVRQTVGDEVYIVVDNCYGEFVGLAEPTHYGADIVVGSLIKNPGGGMAESGGYIAGTKKAVELCSYRLTCPGLGLEVGASLGQNKSLYKGLFYAPHSVASALKTATFAAYVFEKLGYECNPRYDAPRHDIIQAIAMNSPEALCAFCRGIQYASPVDSYVTPEPWDMPGYADKVIMAAGTFTSGSSIELSADGPIRPPYTVFFQGGLTFESGSLGILSAAAEVLRLK